MAEMQRIMTSLKTLKLKSIAYRKTILKIITTAGAGHTGGSLSCVDILNVLYNEIMNITPENFGSVDRDHFIQSKGHAVEALYTVLADVGFFPLEDLDTMERYQSHYIGHPTRHINGIEHNTGALGHGLSVSVGMALGAKLDGRTYRVFTLLGDGELAEGSSWEASLSAAHYQLDNLVVIIDRNKLQITGSTEEVNQLEPLADKFRAFGYGVRTADGNDVEGLVNLLKNLPFEPNKPSLLIAETVKGKGVSFMEDTVVWHHHVPTEQELAAGLQELEQAETQVKDAQLWS
jgi:transketolase